VEDIILLLGHQHITKAAGNPNHPSPSNRVPLNFLKVTIPMKLFIIFSLITHHNTFLENCSRIWI
jgi:hypothetical protein